MDNKTKIFINHIDGVDASTYISNEYMCVSEEEIKKFFASLSAAPLPNDKLRELMNQRQYVSYDSKKLKALEIIKTKRVDITTLLDCYDAKEYNRWNGVRSHYSYPPLEITQEEYDLLKEVLL